MQTVQRTTTGRRKACWISTSKIEKDAIELLMEDHARVKEIFRKFENSSKRKCAEEKEEMVDEICRELALHMQLEEEILYPAVRESIEDGGLMNKAMVERSSVKELILEIQSMNASDPMYEATVAMLNEYVGHHMEEEESRIFPEIKKSKIDLVEMGSDITVCKELLAQEWV
ncbi:MAG: hemerythrin domain-containing protein [Nitrosospira sp.]